ncbi:MAG: DNA repair protein RecN [Solirubrobacterales bacterium]|nr:DNA repair protein RecN [Solirubrobacterales bacterium]MCB8969972.1 DNA repair protein RecN [Thermoleophilales bacterium]MCO5327712.1 DNA repair protein RecN [Solirubrobacterales bacterium]
MLRELRIENLLLIERAELRFGPGLNAITGETGAGKTVLAHSLDLLLGGRPRSAVVRPGCDEAWVEGTFELPEGIRSDPELAELAERLPAEDDEVTLARRVHASSGRSSAFIAGRSASAADLRALGTRMLAFYGQHEHRKLTLAAAQAEILDGYAGADHLELRDSYRAAHAEVVRIGREIAELEAREGARERDIDLLRFELEEIEQAAVEPGEREELLAARDRLRHVEGLREGAAAALAALTGGEEGGAGAAALSAAASAALGRAEGVDPVLDALAERVGALDLELSDIAAELRGYAEGIDADPAALEAAEERLEIIDRLVRKHGGSVEAVLAHADDCRERLAALEHATERRAELEAELAEAGGERSRLGERLSAGRAAAAPRLEAEVAEVLAELAMDGARLEVALEPHSDGLAASGAEAIELRVATNPGMPLAPLGDAASGGELSRVMLALAGLGPGGDVSTLVFDEIDAGVGGQVARRVGERLRALGEGRQVVCITHLAQVASLASTHFRVEKRSEGSSTVATVEAVSGDAQHAEIVRMLGADENDEAAGRHARELLAA